MDGKNDSQSPSKNETIKASNMNENGANDEEKNVMPMELSDTESARAASTAGSADTSSTPEDSRSPTMEVEPQSSVPASIPNENVIQLELPEPGLVPPEPVTNPDVSPPEPVTNSDLTLPQPVKDSTSQESKNQSDIKIEDENIDCEKKKTGAIDSKAAAVVEGAAAPSSSSIDDKAPIQSVYHVKWITFKGKNLPIITQNENGPCPLLAIMNVLLLSEKICLPAMIEMVTSGQLMEYLGDCIFEQAPKNIAEDAQLNYEQNMHDAMAVFHKLQTGLDVNVKFTGCSDFEYTSECIVFDLLAIHLYHGWQVDPDQLEVVAAVGGCSYNQLVEKIIAQKSSEKPELVTEALIAETFLEKSASQLTYHGLSELVTTVKENELCVFFRNNHFSTLYKHKNELFLLVTDQGFLTETNMVWESLSNVEGDGHFVDVNFHTYRKPDNPIPPLVGSPAADQLEQSDYLVALSLQQEQQTGAPWQPPPDQAMMSDEDLARQLQEEEEARARQQENQQQRQAAIHQHLAQQHQLQQQQQQRQQAEQKKSKDCTIL